MKLEVTRGIECGERVCGDESGECGVPLAWPSPHSSPHSPLPQSHPTPHSTSI